MGSDAQGRATGTGTTTGASTLVPATPMVSNPIPDAIVVVNGHPNGSAGNGTVIQGFVFQSGHVGVDSDTGGIAVLSMRVTNLGIYGNRFEPQMADAIDLRATSALVRSNYVIGGQVCDVCLAGPGDFTVLNNRIDKGGIDGILIGAVTLLPVPALVEQYVLPASAAVSAVGPEQPSDRPYPRCRRASESGRLPWAMARRTSSSRRAWTSSGTTSCTTASE